MYFLITMSENSRTIELFTNHFLLFYFKLSDENFNNAKESVKKKKKIVESPNAWAGGGVVSRWG